MKQYQACLDSFECIFHKDFKDNNNQIPECWHFLQHLFYILVLSSAHARRIVSVKRLPSTSVYLGHPYSPCRPSIRHQSSLHLCFMPSSSPPHLALSGLTCCSPGCPVFHSGYVLPAHLHFGTPWCFNYVFYPCFVSNIRVFLSVP